LIKLAYPWVWAKHLGNHSRTRYKIFRPNASPLRGDKIVNIDKINQAMKYNPEIHHRKSIRLKGYDYAQPGAYYITICTYQRQCLFGEIIAGIMHLNLISETIQYCWHHLPQHFPFIKLDAFVIMPNHLHGIILITDANTNKNQLFKQQIIQPVLSEQIPTLPKGTASGSLGALVQNFKSIVTRRVNRLTRNYGIIWQRGYYEKIIRDERAYDNIRKYIVENPLKWQDDENYMLQNCDRNTNSPSNPLKVNQLPKIT
jgi:putative transposase